MREQYNRLQDDFKSKLTEVAGLRADNEQLKKAAKKAEEHRMNAEEKLKEFEKDLRGMKNDKNKVLIIYSYFLYNIIIYVLIISQSDRKKN